MKGIAAALRASPLTSQSDFLKERHFSMSRSIIFAILAFGLLMIANLAVFGYLGFRSLSEKMVTEKLMAGLNEASSLINLQLAEQQETEAVRFTKQIAPHLRGFSYFRAVVVLDRQGRVVHREEIRSRLVRVQTPKVVMEDELSRRLPSTRTIGHTNTPRMIPVQNPMNNVSEETRLALELNAESFAREVETLREELNTKLTIAVFISLVLLGAGLTYVIWLYKRHQALQLKARNADRLAYVGTLSSGLAHEIRNPLNSMNMNVQLIQEELDEMGLDNTGDMYAMLDSTRGEIRRLEKMVSSFLAYARPVRLQTRRLQINNLIMDTLRFLGPEIEKSGIALKTELSPSLPPIAIDENLMKQALINVIQNGVQVLEPGKAMEITTRIAGGDKVLIAIRDEGPGISAEELKNIFKVFYSTKRGGTGLGLPTAQRIAELHHGGIKVESTVELGTTFTLILPMESPPE